jgi:hypothetical protein
MRFTAFKYKLEIGDWGAVELLFAFKGDKGEET